MPVYLVAQLSIHDRSRYAEYVAGFMKVFSGYEGKLLSVDESPQVLEGHWEYTRTVLIEFPSEAIANAWYRSDEYQELARHRFASAQANIVLIKGRP